jgi:pyruvate dehydrogenase E1 component alpha subunit
LKAKRLTDIPSAFGISCVTIDGSDVDELFHIVEEKAKAVRTDRATHFVEVRTTRYPGNMSFWPELAGAETDLKWAFGEAEPPETVRSWSQGSDPLMRFIKKIVSDGSVTREQLLEIDVSVKKRIQEAMEFAVDSPHPPPDEAYCDVWAGGRK